MMSEENSLNRLQIIQKCQTGLMQSVQGMIAQGMMSPELYKKIKKPYADTLYTLGVKDCDVYLLSDDEVAKMMQQAQQAAQNQQPSPDDQKKMADAKLNEAKAQQIMEEIQGNDPDTQLNYMSIATGHAQDYGH
jgi:hypothetical protein